MNKVALDAVLIHLSLTNVRLEWREGSTMLCYISFGHVLNCLSFKFCAYTDCWSQFFLLFRISAKAPYQVNVGSVGSSSPADDREREESKAWLALASMTD